MNVRKRSGVMGGPVGTAPKNSVTTRKDAISQAKSIKNQETSKNKAIGFTAVKNGLKVKP